MNDIDVSKFKNAMREELSLIMKSLHDSEKYHKGGLGKEQIQLAVTLLKAIDRQKALKYLVKSNETFPYKEDYGWEFVPLELKKYENKEYNVEEYLEDNKKYVQEYSTLYKKLIKKPIDTGDFDTLKKYEKRYLEIENF